MLKLNSQCGLLEKGFSMLEMLVVLSIVGIMMGIAVSNINLMNNPSVTSLNQVQGILKLARSRAISTTTPYIVTPVGLNRVVGKRATTCSDAGAVLDPRVQYNLPTGVTLTSAAWSVCFTSRGIADMAVDIGVRDQHGIIKTIEVMRGGAVRLKTS